MLTSRKLFALSFVLSICIFASVGKAGEHVLATITTDVDSEAYQLAISASNEDESLDSFLISNYNNGNINNRDELSIKLFIKEGLKLGVHGPVTFVKINGQNFDEEQGGVIVIDALYNIVTGKRKNYELQLAKSQDGWKLFYEGRPITQIFAKSNKIAIVGVVGAKDLIMK